MNEWIAILTQDGANAPSAYILRNEFGADAVLTRTGPGNYFIEFPDGIDVSKLHMAYTQLDADEGFAYRIAPSTGNVLNLTTYASLGGSISDDVMSYGIHIRLTQGV